MALDSDDLARVALLARLQVDENQTDELTTRLNSILGMVDQLQQANVDDIRPLAHPLDVNQPLRDDLVTEQDIRARVMPLAPDSDGGCFLVPRVIE